ncbi:magnesium transporter NIPA2-like isoform X1 [Haliotis asinina]|uniref:magnesium transporter NIPA2-like isoform X1 n=2 Tax=Haliotis asinina TaxID=109174 RepID=UPI0035322383
MCVMVIVEGMYGSPAGEISYGIKKVFEEPMPLHGSTLSPDLNTTVNTTGNMTSDYEHKLQDMRDFYIGLSLAISSSIFIGSSFIFKKLGLLRLAKHQSTRAGQGGYGYLKEWMWWAGMILMIVGEFANFAAYAFAPATLVTPLGALSVLISAVLASRVLKEHLNLLGKVGCLLCILGSTVMVIHSPKEQEVGSMEALKEKLIEPMFIVFGVVVILAACIGIFYFAPRYGNKNPLVYITICSVLGSFTVMGCKGVGVAIKETFRGRNEFTNYLTYLLLLVVVICILIQLNYLNRALDTFNTAVVTPIYYVFFTSAVIAASLILYKEFGNMEVMDIVGNMCGFLTIISGIFLLNAFKDQNISISTVASVRKEAVSSSNGELRNVTTYDNFNGDQESLLTSGQNDEQLLSEYHHQ